MTDLRKLEDALLLIKLINELDLNTVIQQIEEIKKIHSELKEIANTIKITKSICEKIKSCSKNSLCCFMN
jgi:uncharacterized LabA/DUF88 family protein